MDETAVAGMIFSLLMTGMIGGFVLLYPLSRRLATYLEQRVRGDGAGSPAELGELRETVRALQGQVRELRERQEFLEALAAQRPAPALPEPPERGEL